MKPTPSNEKFAVLDVLRGFALAGVLIANMATHSGFFFMSETQQGSLSTASIDTGVLWGDPFYHRWKILFHFFNIIWDRVCPANEKIRKVECEIFTSIYKKIGYFICDWDPACYIFLRR